jgi:hypothetical protein
LWRALGPEYSADYYGVFILDPDDLRRKLAA